MEIPHDSTHKGTKKIPTASLNKSLPNLPFQSKIFDLPNDIPTGLSKCVRRKCRVYSHYEYAVLLPVQKAKQIEIPAEKKRLSLRKFPAEIRNAIFELALKDDFEEQITISHGYAQIHKIKKPVPAITQVCRQIREETMPVVSHQYSLLIDACNKLEWEQNKTQFRGWRQEGKAIVKMQLRFWLAYDTSVNFEGSAGEKPNCSLHKENTNKCVGLLFDADDTLREGFVKSSIQAVLKETPKSAFDVDKYIQLGDLFVSEYFKK